MPNNPHEAVQVARWIIQKNRMDQARNPDDIERLTKLKLQKLLYYAQGVMLAAHGRPLFSEQVLHWNHGPVVEEVYHHFKCIDGNDIPDDFDEDLAAAAFELIAADEEVRTVLEATYSHFGRYSAWHLREMTHREDPWKNTKRDDVISHDSMRTYFREEILG